MVTLDECGWLGDRARVLPVPARYRDLVEHACLLDKRSAAQADWLVVPDPSAHLLVQVDAGWTGPESLRSCLVGPRTRAVRVDARRRDWTVGLRLRPGALPALTGLPASDFTDRAVSLRELFGEHAEALDRIEEARHPQQLVRHLLTLVRRVAPEGVRDWRARAVAAPLRDTRGRIRVRDLAARSGLSERALRTAAGELLGIAPKLAARIERLHRSLEFACSGRSTAWGRVAAACGYVDQPHLIREFGALLGETPTAFEARARRADTAPDPRVGRS